MAKLYKFSKQEPTHAAFRKAVGDETFNQLHPIGSSLEQQADAADAASKAAADAASKPTIPLPDEDELARIRRRRAARRTGGRDSTVLTGDTFGPG
jgi:hypothetical protein